MTRTRIGAPHAEGGAQIDHDGHHHGWCSCGWCGPTRIRRDIATLDAHTHLTESTT